MTAIYQHVTELHRLGYLHTPLQWKRGDSLLLCLIQVHHLAAQDAALLQETFQHRQLLCNAEGAQLPVTFTYSLEPEPALLQLHHLTVSFGESTQTFPVATELPPAAELLDYLRCQAAVEEPA